MSHIYIYICHMHLYIYIYIYIYIQTVMQVEVTMQWKSHEHVAKILENPSFMIAGISGKDRFQLDSSKHKALPVFCCFHRSGRWNHQKLTQGRREACILLLPCPPTGYKTTILHGFVVPMAVSWNASVARHHGQASLLSSKRRKGLLWGCACGCKKIEECHKPPKMGQAISSYI